LGLLTCKNRLPYNLYCVGGDVKHCSLTHSLTHLFGARLSVSQSQGLIAVPQDNRHIHLYDISGVRYGRPTKMSKVR